MSIKLQVHVGLVGKDEPAIHLLVGREMTLRFYAIGWLDT